MPARPSHPLVVLASLSLLYFLVSAGTFSSLGVVLPAMVGELGWNWTEAGLGFTFLGLACGLSSLVPMVLIRRIGVRRTLAVGTALLVIGFAGLAMTHSVAVYLAATLVIGVAFSLTTTVPGTHVLAATFQRQSLALGTYFTMAALGGVAGPLIYIAVAGRTHDWRLYWWVFVAASVVLGALAAATSAPGADPRSAARTPPEQKGPGEMISGLADWTVRRALATPQFYVIVFAYTMYLLINTTAHGLAVAHLTQRGISTAAAARMLSGEALIGAAVSIGGGLAGERVSAKTLLVVSLAALVIGMAALAVAHGPAMMLVYAVGVGIGYGLTFLAATVLLLRYFGRGANLELYSLMCLISTVAAIGPASAGWARDVLGSFQGVFLVCAGGGLVMLVLAAFLRPPVLQTAARARATVS